VPGDARDRRLQRVGRRGPLLEKRQGGRVSSA